MYQKKFSCIAILGLTIAFMTPAWSATLINLATQPTAALQSLAAPEVSMQQINSHIDFNQTTHVRVQQMVAGYPVWGADAVVHIPHGGQIKNLTALQPLLQNAKNNKTTITGTFYQALNADLSQTPAYVFTSVQANKVLTHATELYQQQAGMENPIKQPKTNRVVYVDDDSKAHWAYVVSFLVERSHAVPVKPTYIIDATNLKVYESWNNIQTVEGTVGGGFGGNRKMGKLVYDSLGRDLSQLTITRNAQEKMCYLQNDEVVVLNRLKEDSVVNFSCKKMNAKHNQEYWDADEDAVNGGYSPANDALYAGGIIKAMYQQWYGVPALVEDGKPMLLVMRVHEDIDNAYWDGEQMTFGDGVTTFYPLVSLDVAAHEVSHGFTEQHSNLQYYGQAGGLNESFSDMAAMAAQYYSLGKNTWQIGADILKAKHEALRYMDHPTKDCDGRHPGLGCSIENAKDYKKSIDVHYSSGVYNRLFYLLATANGWNTKKAFDVMVQANMNYWTSNTNFAQAACAVIQAARDYNYDLTTVNNAIAKVGLHPNNCTYNIL